MIKVVNVWHFRTIHFLFSSWHHITYAGYSLHGNILHCTIPQQPIWIKRCQLYTCIFDHQIYCHEIVNCVYMYMNCSNHFGCFSPYTIRSHRSSWSLICSMSTIWLEMTKLNIQRRPGKLSISDIPSGEHRRHEMGFQTTVWLIST